MRQHPDIVTLMRLMNLAGLDLDDYMERVRTIPLLDREDELALATLMQQGKSARQDLDELLAKHDGRKPVARDSQVVRLMDDVVAGEEAWLRLTFHNLRFAVWVARVSMRLETPRRTYSSVRQITSLPRFAEDRLPLEDRVQEATLVLAETVRLYLPNPRVKLVSYAGKRIYTELRRAILDERYRNGLGVGEADSMAKTAGVAARYRRRTGREAPVKFLMDETGQGEVAVTRRLEEQATMPLRTLEELYRSLSLRDPTTHEMRQPGDLFWDPEAPNGPYAYFLAERSAAIKEVLETLSVREAGVIRLRFGLVDGVCRTQSEVATVYGVTAERIRQLESKTMSRLRHPSRSDTLRPFLDDESNVDWPWHEMVLLLQRRPAQAGITVQSHPYLYPKRLREEMLGPLWVE